MMNRRTFIKTTTTAAMSVGVVGIPQPLFKDRDRVKVQATKYGIHKAAIGMEGVWLDLLNEPYEDYHLVYLDDPIPVYGRLVFCYANDLEKVCYWEKK